MFIAFTKLICTSILNEAGFNTSQKKLTDEILTQNYRQHFIVRLVWTSTAVSSSSPVVRMLQWPPKILFVVRIKAFAVQ